MGFVNRLFDSLGISPESPEQALLIVFAAIIAIGVFMIVLLLIRGSGRGSQSGDTDRLGGALGRLEKLERSLNEFRTETVRSIELFKGDSGFVKQELREIRNILAQRDSSPTSGGGGSQGEVESPEVTVIEESSSVLTDKEERRRDSWIAPDTEEGATSKEKTSGLGVEESPPEVLSKRLVKSRIGFFSRIKQIFAGRPRLDAEALEELEAQLIGSDLGIKTVQSLIEEVKLDISNGEQVDEAGLAGIFKRKVLSILQEGVPTDLSISPIKRGSTPLVVMMVGVNGVGKTTTTAKLSSLWKDSGAKVLMVAADTFRAAAVEQIKEWGERIGVPVVSGAPDAKPQTVVFDAMQRAMKESFDVVIIDTAGRLHTKSNLMQELEGVKNILNRTIPEAPHETILVVDGTTGSNAVNQAREFNSAVPLTGLIVTKLDGTPKGGVVVAIKNDLGIPIRYIGVGEARGDLRPFVASDFVEALFDSSDIKDESSSTLSAHGETRRRKRREGEALITGFPVTSIS